MQALKAAAEGRTSPNRLPDRFRRAAEPASDNGTAVFWAVVVATYAWPRGPEQYRRDAVRDKQRCPLYGDFASNITPCAFWDRPAEPITKVNTSA